MTVVIDNTPAADYDWVGANFDWISVESNKTWAAANVDDWTADISESVAFAEAVTKNIELVKSESLLISDDFERTVAFVLAFAESLHVAETYSDLINYTMNFVESFAITDKLGKTLPELALEEAFSVAESGFAKEIALEIAESIVVADLLGRTVAFNLQIDEGFGVADSLAKAIELPFSESIAFLEEYLRGANAVISDILIGTDEITSEEFMTKLTSGSSPGYEDFRTFVPGDYEYKDALFKVVMKSIGESRPRLTKLTAEADVPDVHDRGEETIGAATATINFTRTFYVAPEVVATLRASSVLATPKITNITTAGFDVVLLDGSESPVAGTISWAAHGY